MSDLKIGDTYYVRFTSIDRELTKYKGKLVYVIPAMSVEPAEIICKYYKVKEGTDNYNKYSRAIPYERMVLQTIPGSYIVIPRLVGTLVKKFSSRRSVPKDTYGDTI